VPNKRNFYDVKKIEWDNDIKIILCLPCHQISLAFFCSSSSTLGFKKKKKDEFAMMRFIEKIDQICEALKRLELTLNESENKSQAEGGGRGRLE
jgi:hypothetical protein